ncbi:PGG domain, partial [Dillenia turbinata]
MDPILFKAARDGNVESLLKLLERDPLTLDRVATYCADTPLHIAAMLGHHQFIKELVKHQSRVAEYAKELNRDGFSAMHLASANGHTEVVKALLEISHELCGVKGREKKTPLHCAAIKGRADIISELVMASPVCALEVTSNCQTALHLAIKSNQFEALKVLVEKLKQHDMDEVLNFKDDEGNTVVELLVNYHNRTPGALQINTVNDNGLTPLDLLLICQCEIGDAEIERILRNVGAVRALVLNNPTPVISSASLSRRLSYGNGVLSRSQSSSPRLNGRNTMDPVLFKAARDGNVESLLRLLESDPLILDRVATHCADTPLHIAAMLGHLDFVRELIRCKDNAKEYAKELNQDGFSAMHLASANGHVNIVQALIGLGYDLCSVKGRENKTPIHCAAMKGRAEIITQILSASPFSAMDVTARCQTALHLAVKNNQFDALRALVDKIKQNDMEDVLNFKDNEGNTVLHLAIAKNNFQASSFVKKLYTFSILISKYTCTFQVVKLLVNNQNGTPGLLQVNAVNNSSLTALDLLLICQSESGNAEIERILRQAGAVRAATPASHSSLPSTSSPRHDVAQSSNSPSNNPSQDKTDAWERCFKFQFGRDKPEDVRNILLVVFVVLATTTYQAGLSPPGGIMQEGERKGEAVLASYTFPFIWFMFVNSAGFFVSMLTISELTNGFPFHGELLVAVTAMMAAYDCGMVSVTPPGGLRMLFALLSVCMPFGIAYAANAIRTWHKKHK